VVLLLLASCASSGDGGSDQALDSETQKASSSGDSRQVTREQALEILAQSDKYLNPIDKNQSGDHKQVKSLSIPQEGASESPRNDGVHDTQNDAIAVLQDPVKALADFPRDRRNQVDWVAALDQGLISPRANLTGDAEMQTLDLDIVMKNTQFMPWVRFPHIVHTRWLACSNCHPKIFIPKENANPISMNKVLRGEYCGVCHDKVAFAIFICERCHSVPHKGSGKKWW
jgi:c(7)-type cytochrome triheme protein